MFYKECGSISKISILYKHSLNFNYIHKTYFMRENNSYKNKKIKSESYNYIFRIEI